MHQVLLIILLSIQAQHDHTNLTCKGDSTLRTNTQAIRPTLTVS
uniref:Uncharacterized protein n=1 Tax=Rhizophora mucronata TaxID=61149 RepID=A0A2P2JHF1_RHIMU